MTIFKEPTRLADLRERLDIGETDAIDPFGQAMTTALEDARFDPDAWVVVWIVGDYGTPPLTMEREAVLDEYFESLTVVDANVDEKAGWDRIEHLPSIWGWIEAVT